MTVYAFCHSDYESYTVMSLHISKKGAYQAMRDQLVKDYNQWFEDRLIFGKKMIYSDKFNGNQMCNYHISTRIILP